MSQYLPVQNPTKPFWLSEEDQEVATLRSTPELPKEVDVVVVGSGYAGTTTSYYLLENSPSTSILMLEARNACSGATARNGGHLKPDLYYAHNAFKSKYGEKGAAEIINFEHDHIRGLKQLVEKEKIECDFVLTRSCDVHLTPGAVEKAIVNYNAMTQNPYVKCKDDLQIAYGEAAKVISKVEGSPVCVTYTAGQLWPYKFVIGIMKKNLAKGLNLQTNTPVLHTEKLKNGKYLVKTSRGDVIAKQLVLATNAYTASVEPRFEDKIVPIKGACSHIVSSDPSKRTPHLTNTYGIRFDGADTDYLINRPDGSVILGGAKKHIYPHKSLFYKVVDDSTLIPNSKEYFSESMKKLFYTWKDFDSKVDYVWSGILGYTDDSLPYVGELPGDKNKFIIAGFHGHGMPRVLLCAKALAKVIAKKSKVLEIPSAFKITKDRMENTKNEILESLGTPSTEKAKL
ncbi:hypothetical protein CANARDRAFT_26271 [[Candida] arabinofermentans NRRL YB-2248]|uniref:FAD dependent oxidoreductase domain-containing protein n=1 Tax=[Candida] arabinofermentans NRRL YB-2248 TaxID=983967 RepID=A0A1E4T8M9_9ASCO|nr:hypothetical protein CANARDRAFT_26271 [[Candida] arabinofermentans NRRL YB-2248]